jgi:hypothetical protein
VAQLQQLASTGLQKSYTAIYTLTATSPRGSARYTVRRTPKAYRVDVRRGNTTAILIHNTHGTYSCQTYVKHRPTCLLVAKPGSPVPSLFDAGQKMWSDYLTELSQNANAYLVTASGTTPPNGSRPAGTCFAVAVAATPSATSLATGTYCFTDEGIPTKARFLSGTFILRSIVAAPHRKDLLPLAKPTPIPGLK